MLSPGLLPHTEKPAGSPAALTPGISLSKLKTELSPFPGRYFATEWLILMTPALSPVCRALLVSYSSNNASRRFVCDGDIKIMCLLPPERRVSTFPNPKYLNEITTELSDETILKFPFTSDIYNFPSQITEEYGSLSELSFSSIVPEVLYLPVLADITITLLIFLKDNGIP